MDVTLTLEGSAALDVVALHTRERLGETSVFELECFTTAPPRLADLVGKGAAIVLHGGPGARTLLGTVTRASMIASSHGGPGRRMRLVVSSATAHLALRRRSKTFQRITVANIVKEVLLAAGIPADRVDVSRAGKGKERRWVVQYDETDLAFVRRLCEEEGLFFRFEERDGRETFVLDEGGVEPPPLAPDTLALVDEHSSLGSQPVAVRLSQGRNLRAGKVHVHAYDHESPKLELAADKTAGHAREKALERLFASPPRTPKGEEATRAERLLEAVRTDAETIHLTTNHLGIAPGLGFSLESASELLSTPPSGTLLVVAVEHHFRRDAEARIVVEARTTKTPYRLPLVTPRPRAPGLQSAIVTGPPGEEIHVDELGRVTLHFLWDREGKTDQGSSPAFRVAQANTPGSLIHPRIGWEVIAAFEGGDPERPVVLGRTYNGKFGPPAALPANKTMTSWSSVSSPGGKVRSGVTFDDAGGRQHLAIASHHLHFEATRDHTRNVKKNESHKVDGNSSLKVGGNFLMASVGALDMSAKGPIAITVGALHKTTIAGTQYVRLGVYGSEVGGVLLEKIGNPVEGFKALGRAAILSIPGVVGGVLGTSASVGLKMLGIASETIGFAAGYAAAADTALASGAYQDRAFGAIGLAKAPAPTGGAQLPPAPTDALHNQGNYVAAGTGIVTSGTSVAALFGKNAPPGIAAGLAGVTAVSGSIAQGVGVMDDFREMDAAQGDAQSGGGAATSASKAAGPVLGGAGKRDTSVMGGMFERIGALYSVTTPGPVTLTVAGYSRTNVGGSLTVRTAMKYGYSARTVLTIKVSGSQTIRAPTTVTREATAKMKITSLGDASARARGAMYVLGKGGVGLISKAPLTIKGSDVTFVVGGSKLTIESSGISIVTSDLVINKQSVVDKVASHT